MRTKRDDKRGSLRRVAVRVGKILGCAAAGAVVVLLFLGIKFLNKKPELEPWHTVLLEEEFTVSSPEETFEGYLKLEERLFAELDKEVYDRVGEAKGLSINRYQRGSRADPGIWPRNWNRSYELNPESSAGTPKAAVLLIHGLTDSPYSLHHLGKRLQGEGAYVLGMRVPGHGTIPSALTKTTWEDMAAAVELAMKHLHAKADGQPLYVVGYSNGGALAVHYALSALEDSELPAPAGIALISPEIGVSKMASALIWQERIGRILGLQKLSWTSVGPEYDPFKYNSFPANAGNLAYQFTNANRKLIVSLGKEGKLAAFPPVIAFQSSVDATVSVTSLVRDLFDQLPANRHELVVFDVNRNPVVEALLNKDPKDEIGLVLDDSARAFDFTVLTKAGPTDPRVVERSWAPGAVKFVQADTELQWPLRIYSLSHVALPFPADDPLYGGSGAPPGPGIQIGRIALHGEKGAISISATEMLRQRWNPFYPYLEDHVVDHFGLSGPAVATDSAEGDR